MFNICVYPDVNNVQWKVDKEKESASKREELSLTVCLVDCWNNEVQINTPIPELVNAGGPDGLTAHVYTPY